MAMPVGATSNWRKKKKKKPSLGSTPKRRSAGRNRTEDAAGILAGMGAGAALGTAGGPLAPFTIPLGAIAGGITGWWGSDKLQEVSDKKTADEESRVAKARTYQTSQQPNVRTDNANPYGLKGKKPTYSSSSSTKTKRKEPSDLDRLEQELDNILKGVPGVNIGITDEDISRAKNLIGIEYDPAINQVKRNKKQAKIDYKRLVQELQDERNFGTRSEKKYGKIYDKNLQEIYNNLNAALNTGKAKTADIFKQGTADVAAGYNEAAATQSAAGKQVQDLLAGRAEGIGMEGANPSLETLVADLAGTTARTAGSKAAAKGNITTRGTEAVSAAQAGIDTAKKEKAQTRAVLNNNVADALGKIHYEYAQGRTKLSQGLQDQLRELNGQLTDLYGSRGKALKEEIKRLSESRSDREFQRRAQAVSEKMEILNAKTGLANEKQRRKERRQDMRLASQTTTDDTAKRANEAVMRKIDSTWTGPYATALKAAWPEVHTAMLSGDADAAEMKLNEIAETIYGKDDKTRINNFKRNMYALINTYSITPSGSSINKGYQ